MCSYSLLLDVLALDSAAGLVTLVDLEFAWVKPLKLVLPLNDVLRPVMVPRSESPECLYEDVSEKETP